MKRIITHVSLLCATLILMVGCSKKSSGPVLPTVSTVSFSTVTNSSAMSGGTIVSDGGSAITAKGVCWGTAAGPSVSLSSKTTDGTGNGSFTSVMTGLTAGTTYYVRAYATNAGGTAYGGQQAFIALSVGDSYSGGKLAHLLLTGDAGYDSSVPHGVIAALADQDTSLTWYQASVKKFILAGFSDWHVPTKAELHYLYSGQAAIGGFTSTGDYWSSTEFDYDNGVLLYFFNGYELDEAKSATNRIRPVRSF